MTNGELLKKLEDFLQEVEQHRELWRNSIARAGTLIGIKKNQKELEQQLKSLNEKFGSLEKYLSQLVPTRRYMGNSYGTWDAWTIAIGDLRGLDKGKSMEVFIRHLLQAIGILKGEPVDKEFPLNGGNFQKSGCAESQRIVEILKSFNPCYSYLKSKGKYQINSEEDVKHLLYVMLRSCFENVEWEECIPKAGGKGHRIDLVVKDCSTLIETKFIRDKNHADNIMAELNDDLIGYTTSNCEGFIAFIYDPQKFIIDPQKLSHFYREQTSQYRFIDVRVVN